jgi:hypothetical protein
LSHNFLIPEGVFVLIIIRQRSAMLLVIILMLMVSFIASPVQSATPTERFNPMTVCSNCHPAQWKDAIWSAAGCRFQSATNVLTVRYPACGGDYQIARRRSQTRSGW